MLPLLRIILSALSAFILWRLVRRAFGSSPLENIPGPPSKSLLKGHYFELYHRQGWQFHEKLWKEYGAVVRLRMSFGTPCLYISDPRALHHLLIADPSAVDQSSFIVESYRILLGPGLMSAIGDQHRRQRKMLNPVFSVKNLRDMLPLFYKVINQLEQAISATVGNEAKELDILQWMNRGSLELIGQAGLGYTFGNIVAPTSNDYARALKSVFPTLSRIGSIRQLTPYLVKIGSSAFRRRVLELLPNKNIQDLLAIVDTMDRKSNEILQSRRAELQSAKHASSTIVGDGKDIMSYLLRANMEADAKDRLSDQEIIGQMSSFVLAGTDSTASILTQILQYLAQHPQKQEMLRKEIVEAKNGGDLQYDDLMRLPYLDAIVKETLRLNPPPSMVSRQTQKDTMLPVDTPIRGVDGKLMTEILVPKGTIIFVGILAMNRSEAIWGDDAFEWKPERWLGDLPNTVTDARIPGIYSSLMTFVGGNRTCIGFKFAEMELKAMLSVLIESFSLTSTSKDIVWNLAAVRFPTVGIDGAKPELPLVVSRRDHA